MAPPLGAGRRRLRLPRAGALHRCVRALHPARHLRALPLGELGAAPGLDPTCRAGLPRTDTGDHRARSRRLRALSAAGPQDPAPGKQRDHA